MAKHVLPSPRHQLTLRHLISRSYVLLVSFSAHGRFVDWLGLTDGFLFCFCRFLRVTLEKWRKVRKEERGSRGEEKEEEEGQLG